MSLIVFKNLQMGVPKYRTWLEEKHFFSATCVLCFIIFYFTFNISDKVRNNLFRSKQEVIQQRRKTERNLFPLIFITEQMRFNFRRQTVKFDFKTPCEGNTASSFPDPHFIGLNSLFRFPVRRTIFFFLFLFLAKRRER